MFLFELYEIISNSEHLFRHATGVIIVLIITIIITITIYTDLIISVIVILIIVIIRQRCIIIC